jgi:hypothetical protein
MVIGRRSWIGMRRLHVLVVFVWVLNRGRGEGLWVLLLLLLLLLLLKLLMIDCMWEVIALRNLRKSRLLLHAHHSHFDRRAGKRGICRVGKERLGK